MLIDLKQTRKSSGVRPPNFNPPLHFQSGASSQNDSTHHHTHGHKHCVGLLCDDTCTCTPLWKYLGWVDVGWSLICVPFANWSFSPNWFWIGFKIHCTVEPRYNEVLGTMKINLLYQVSHYIRVKKQRNIKSWDQQNYLVIRGFVISDLFITRFHCIVISWLYFLCRCLCRCITFLCEHIMQMCIHRL